MNQASGSTEKPKYGLSLDDTLFNGPLKTRMPLLFEINVRVTKDLKICRESSQAEQKSQCNLGSKT